MQTQWRDCYSNIFIVVWIGMKAEFVLSNRWFSCNSDDAWLCVFKSNIQILLNKLSIEIGWNEIENEKNINCISWFNLNVT